MPEQKQLLNDVLMDNYLPYASYVILSRSIPAIDGMKPVQRKILYTMYKMGLINGNRTKCANIVGQTMKLHPHGDSAIYEAMAALTQRYEGLNIPYIDGKGNFGKAYSRDMACAASRYTEAKLHPICAELFESLDEDAVSMIDNYDGSMKEPELLPVKYPNILTNPMSGIAVGMSCTMPAFNLKEVCEATINVLNGSNSDPVEFVNQLGSVEYPNGGLIQRSQNSNIMLANRGTGSFTYYGSATTYTNRIEINSIPFDTKLENIMEKTWEHIKAGNIKGIADIHDDSDLNGFKITADLKRGANPKQVLNSLFKYTDLRSSMSYQVRVVLTDENGDLSCKENPIGLYELIEKWIQFRLDTVQRIYKHKLNVANDKLELLESWEKINGHIKEIAIMIVENEDDEKSKQVLMKQYGLNERQADYVLDLRLRNIPKEKVLKRLEELKKIKSDIDEYKTLVTDEKARKIMVIKQLKEIANKYGKDKRVKDLSESFVFNPDEGKEEEQEDNSLAIVVYTKQGFIKRFANVNQEQAFEMRPDDAIVSRWVTNNSRDLLVFSFYGDVHKVPVNSIDASRGEAKDKLHEVLGFEHKQELMYIDDCGDYSGYINVVYDNGSGKRVMYSEAIGKRKKYKNMFRPSAPGQIFLTKDNKFFIVTKRKKASYVDLTNLQIASTRVAFKGATIDGNDKIIGLLPLNQVADIKTIDLEKFSKPYCIKIKDEKFWA